jgi:hypothetical protein
MNIKLPPLNKRTIASALVLAGIGAASNMIATYWQHRCQRKTDRLNHEAWKERYAIASSNEDDIME